MRISYLQRELTKRHPLTISRGTIYGSTNLFVRVEHEGVVGWGEMAPSDVTGDSAETAAARFDAWSVLLESLAPHEFDRIDAVVHDVTGAGSATRAALDSACHDWLGNKVGMPVWSLLGVDRTRTPETSLTIGIGSAEVLRNKVPEILNRTGARILKVKLGQPSGIDADQDMFVTVQAAAASIGAAELKWRVDANGGWSVADAKTMIVWLTERGVDMIEQPLVQGAESEIGGVCEVASARGVPVFLDESIRTSHDVARFANGTGISGVNLKLMKCGGIREGLRIIHTARAHGLQVMIGCMGESSLAIAAGAQLGGLVDALDLDSHLNLTNDPLQGMEIVDGRVVAGSGPGLGVSWIESADPDFGELMFVERREVPRD